MAISLKTINDIVTSLQSSKVQAISLRGKYASNKLCGTNPTVTKSDATMSSSSGNITVPAGKYLVLLGFYINKPSESYGSISIQLRRSDNTVILDFGAYGQDHYGYGGLTCCAVASFTSTTTLYPYATISGVGAPSNHYCTILKLYYNFSYNIIYKIYTKYKFQLLAILTHLLFKRRCKKYGY